MLILGTDINSVDIDFIVGYIIVDILVEVVEVVYDIIGYVIIIAIIADINYVDISVDIDVEYSYGINTQREPVMNVAENFNLAIKRRSR